MHLYVWRKNPPTVADLPSCPLTVTFQLGDIFALFVNCSYHRLNKVHCADPIEEGCMYTRPLVFIDVVHGSTDHSGETAGCLLTLDAAQAKHITTQTRPHTVGAHIVNNNNNNNVQKFTGLCEEAIKADKI